MNNEYRSFFSISFDLIPLEEEITFDLYVNSSARSERERYVRIFPAGRSLKKRDLDEFKVKYHRLYVPEKQRKNYFDSLIKSRKYDTKEKTTVIKDTAIQYLDKIFNEEKEFTTEALKDTVEGCRDSVESMVEVIQDYSIEEIKELIASLSFHDFYTYDHSINVSMYAISLLKACKPNCSQKEQVEVGMGGLLHDLGKIKIPIHLINNPGELTEEEFGQIKMHPRYGIELMEDCKDSFQGLDLSVIKRVIYEHHENFNGTGYPNKLAGKKIHLYARITAICDFFDAITTKRSYHEALTTDQALELMDKSKGKKIDPELFDRFVKMMKKYVKSGKGEYEVPDDFDPCQPHKELPIQKVKVVGDDEDYGRIKGKEEFLHSIGKNPEKKKKESA